LNIAGAFRDDFVRSDGAEVVVVDASVVDGRRELLHAAGVWCSVQSLTRVGEESRHEWLEGGQRGCDDTKVQLDGGPDGVSVHIESVGVCEVAVLSVYLDGSCSNRDDT